MRVIPMGLLALAIFLATAVEGAEVNDLVVKLRDKDSDVRRAAAKDLAELGPDARAATPDLAKALRDRDLFVRRFAAEALGKIGPEAKASIPALGMAMSDERKEVQIAAATALGQMGADGIPALIAAVKDPNKDPAVRRIATQGLGKIGPQARGAVPAFTDILTGRIKAPKAVKKGKTNDDDFRIDVAVALGSVAKSEDRAAIDALKSVSEGKQRNKALQRAANDSLRKLTGSAPARKKK